MPFALSAALTIGLLITGAVVSATRYREMVDIETRAGRLTYLVGQIVRLNEAETAAARMVAATGNPTWVDRYHAAEHPLDMAIEETLALAPEHSKRAAQRALAVDAQLATLEDRAVALGRAGKYADALAVFDASYDAQREAYNAALDESLGAISADVTARIDEHHSMMRVALVVGGAALVFLTSLWLRLAGLVRRYIHDCNVAEAELRRTHATLETRVDERTRELAASRKQFQFLIENIEAIPFEWEPAAHRLLYVGPQAAALLDCPPTALQDPELLANAIHDDDRQRLRERVDRFVAGEYPCTIDFRMLTWSKRTVTVRMFLGGRVDRTAVGVLLDITRQVKLESELQQSQKLESVGRLAAGIAHEINTPIQFVSDSVQFARDAIAEAIPVIGKHHHLAQSALGCPSCGGLARAALDAESEVDMAYLSEQLPEALERARDGLSRVATIVRSMKVFAHPDRREQTQASINEAIESTLTIARNEYKYIADAETHFGDLPLVTCYLGELNQVILNLVVNAAHAIGDTVDGTQRRGKITVTTRVDGNDAVVAITDTGTGIPVEVRDRIFDPFFTTKEVGKGTGQGLSHARAVIVDKHRGTLTFETALGAGTTFYIRLPIAGISDRAAAPEFPSAPPGSPTATPSIAAST